MGREQLRDRWHTEEGWRDRVKRLGSRIEQFYSGEMRRPDVPQKGYNATLYLPDQRLVQIGLVGGPNDGQYSYVVSSIPNPHDHITPVESFEITVYQGKYQPHVVGDAELFNQVDGYFQRESGGQ